MAERNGKGRFLKKVAQKAAAATTEPGPGLRGTLKGWAGYAGKAAKKSPTKLIGKLIAKLSGMGIGGPLAAFMAIWLVKDVADMFGYGTQSREIAAGEKRQQASLLANAMLIADESKLRTAERGERELARTQSTIAEGGRQAGLRELAMMNVQASGARRAEDFGGALGTAAAMDQFSPPGQVGQAGVDDPLRLLGL